MKLISVKEFRDSATKALKSKEPLIIMRSGDLDPGILLYVMNEKGYDSRMIEDMVNERAGLLGVSSISPDMKTLLEKRESEPHAV